MELAVRRAGIASGNASPLSSGADATARQIAATPDWSVSEPPIASWAVTPTAIMVTAKPTSRVRRIRATPGTAGARSSASSSARLAPSTPSAAGPPTSDPSAGSVGAVSAAGRDSNGRPISQVAATARPVPAPMLTATTVRAKADGSSVGSCEREPVAAGEQREQRGDAARSCTEDQRVIRAGAGERHGADEHGDHEEGQREHRQLADRRFCGPHQDPCDDRHRCEGDGDRRHEERGSDPASQRQRDDDRSGRCGERDPGQRRWGGHPFGDALDFDPPVADSQRHGPLGDGLALVGAGGDEGWIASPIQCARWSCQR